MGERGRDWAGSRQTSRPPARGAQGPRGVDGRLSGAVSDLRPVRRVSVVRLGRYRFRRRPQNTRPSRPAPSKANVEGSGMASPANVM